MEVSPSSKGFEVTDLLLKIITWRQDLGKFFADVTGLTPRPFQESFFKEVQEMKSRNIVIVAGRGIGKTIALAVVALWYVFVLALTERRPFKVIILAGSLDQAKICFTYIMDFISSTPFLQRHLAKEPTQREILFKDGSWIKPLPASEKSIRGHHPDLLIIDEAAQVEDDIIYAALPMTATSPYARHIFSTTPSEGYSWIEHKWEHQTEYSYPTWKFFNWNAESFLKPEEIEFLKKSMPANKYCSEIQGLPYKREGKVFRLEDLKECQEDDIKFIPGAGEVYAGVDWGYYPAPTALVIVQNQQGVWKVLFTQEFLAQNFEEVHDKIKEICDSYGVKQVFTDSTDKGENLRLSSKGLPVNPVAFKGEKSTMIANLRMLVEQHKIR
ncbi:MAG: terminase large subunit, partial [Candidatus Jordarchaeales archaeon]